MNIENIKELALKLRKSNYKDLFGALVVFHFIENEHYYENEVNELGDIDLIELENMYIRFMNNDNIKGLLNEDLIEIIEEIGGK